MIKGYWSDLTRGADVNLRTIQKAITYPRFGVENIKISLKMKVHVDSLYKIHEKILYKVEPN